MWKPAILRNAHPIRWDKSRLTDQRTDRHTLIDRDAHGCILWWRNTYHFSFRPTVSSFKTMRGGATLSKVPKLLSLYPDKLQACYAAHLQLCNATLSEVYLPFGMHERNGWSRGTSLHWWHQNAQNSRGNGRWVKQHSCIYILHDQNAWKSQMNYPWVEQHPCIDDTKIHNIHEGFIGIAIDEMPIYFTGPFVSLFISVCRPVATGRYHSK